MIQAHDIPRRRDHRPRPTVGLEREQKSLRSLHLSGKKPRIIDLFFYRRGAEGVEILAPAAYFAKAAKARERGPTEFFST